MDFNITYYGRINDTTSPRKDLTFHMLDEHIKATLERETGRLTKEIEKMIEYNKSIHSEKVRTQDLAIKILKKEIKELIEDVNMLKKALASKI